MAMDVSFWEPPSWKKESSISPVFLGILGLAVLVFLAIGYYVTLLQSQSSLESAYKFATQENKSLSSEYGVLVELDKYTKYMNESVLGELKYRRNSNFLVSQLYQQLEASIPNDMVLTEVSFDAFNDFKGKKKKDTVGCLRYRVIIKGYSFGVSPTSNIGRYAKFLRSKEGLGDKLVSVVIKGAPKEIYSENLFALKSTFMIDCVFKEKTEEDRK